MFCDVVFVEEDRALDSVENTQICTRAGNACSSCVCVRAMKADLDHVCVPGWLVVRRGGVI